MIIYGLSDIGLIRPRNEDRFLIREFSANHALISVMDGMGGQSGGALAAQLAHDVLAEFTPNMKPAPEQLHELMLKANERILQEEEKNPDLYGLGTTLTMALIKNGEAHWAHVGDSRLFHYHNADLVQVTTDHNMAQFLYQEGELTMTEAMQSPLRNLLDQGLGGSFVGEDISSLILTPGDRLLLCTDGVHNEIRNDQIAAVMSSHKDMQSVCHALVQLALKTGGKDNITVIALEY